MITATEIQYSSNSVIAMAHTNTTSPIQSPRSRCPLSHMDAEALHNLLSLTPTGSTSLLTRESGYFSEYNPTSVTSSLHRISELSSELSIRTKDRLEVERPLQQAAEKPMHFQFPPAQEDAIDMDSLINEIFDEFGVCWKELGRFLLRKECIVENIAVDYEKVSERAYQVLLHWRRERGKNATISELFNALLDIGKDSVAQQLLTYLPKSVAKSLSATILNHVKSPRNVRCASMPNIKLNIPEQLRDLEVDTEVKCGQHSKVVVCHSHASNKKYLLRQITTSSENCVWAARKTVSCSELRRSMKNLRKTNELMKELKLKQDSITKLKDIVETLQSHLKNRQVNFCPENQTCQECEKTKVKQELILKELELLHHELGKMEMGNRRLSITGIPTEHIYGLAERAYNVCEEHKKMHEERKIMRQRCSQELLDVADEGAGSAKGKGSTSGGKGSAGKGKVLNRKCSQEILDVGDTDSDEDLAEEIEGPIQCTLKILLTFGRRRKSVQSLRQRKQKKSKKVQRNESDKCLSRFYVPLRNSYLEAVEKQALLTTWPPLEDWKLPELEKLKELDSERKAGQTPKARTRPESTPAIATTQNSRGCHTAASSASAPGIPELRRHVRSNTFPSSFSKHPGHSFAGPEDLQLDDIDDVGSSFGSVRGHKPNFIIGDSQARSHTGAAYERSHRCDIYERDVRRRVSDHRPPLRDQLEYHHLERSQSFSERDSNADELTMRSSVSDSTLQRDTSLSTEPCRSGNRTRANSPLDNIEWAHDIDLADIICV